MDVQAASATVTLPPQPSLAYTAPAASPDPSLAPIAAPAAAPVAPASPVASGPSGSDIGNSPGLATLPASATEAEKAAARAVASAADGSGTALAGSVAKLFNEREANVEVSFRIESGVDQVVTVFTDKQTGKTIVQFPSETLIALAQFFNKLGGGLLDKKV